ncbi:type II toxin-antitoxin system VapC family toxin [Acinetobacter sp. VNH17]|uniref:Ribonuclease VapC n=1 Tax=Acinetobacter thutiue TaxID=2998078 RepID=A0ABT7WPQ5_9GAMM|nr:type II toxin-antitoxin system VapC family toxin [Acinetobacter thutiue]MCY6412555.1 type II toxin-antitoxin system VapC family toxin [Acinetobacter thutiue]MDN0014662.1 type II toxin-antitoxin system VapC family toxin [Acinetobacter thutiue]
MIYLLDTNICIYVINHKPQQVFERFRQYPLGQLAVSSITASELAFGVEKSCSERNKQALKKFLSPLEILPYDEQAIWHYAQLRHDLQSKGQTIGSLDMLIAAHALALDMVLVTNNTKEFERIERLKLENWV